MKYPFPSYWYFLVHPPLEKGEEEKQNGVDFFFLLFAIFVGGAVNGVSLFLFFLKLFLQ